MVCVKTMHGIIDTSIIKKNKRIVKQNEIHPQKVKCLLSGHIFHSKINIKQEVHRRDHAKKVETMQPERLICREAE